MMEKNIPKPDEGRTRDVYSDGDVENEILEIFRSADAEKRVEKALQGNPSWPMFYHLSPARQNLLDWYGFDPEGRLLEIGAGCGAITGLFCERLKSVTAIELSARRAKIITERHKGKKNLTVYPGNLNDIDLKEKFDYVSLIGVLEYAGKYTHSDNPFLDFLIKTRGYLAEGGTMVIAIENRFGLKYWSGVGEDHTGKLFDSITGYRDNVGIKTFGKKELYDLLKRAGFEKADFYYPMPDYKLPTEIFSEGYLPTEKHGVSPGIFPFQDLARPRRHFFDERLAMDGIVENGQFDFFANSFLIFAKL